MDMEDEAGRLQTYEEFRATFDYFFMLFQKEFTPALEAAARRQWEQLQAGDVSVQEDGQNNPLVEMRLDPAFGNALCAALAGPAGDMPVLRVPPTSEQRAFWKSRAKSLPEAGAGPLEEIADALSEAASHLETLRQAIAWHLATGGAAPMGASASAGPGARAAAPLRVFILGASARYEYVAHHGGGIADWSEPEAICGALAEVLGETATAAAPGRPVEFILCGRDVPEALDGREDRAADGAVTVRHRIGYLHDLPEAQPADKLSGALFVALHGGLGLNHPELAETWPPTLQLLGEAAPVWFAVTSFNCIEHGIARRALEAALPGRVSTDRTGENPCGSTFGLPEVGPFDGCQGKRNYCWFCARISPSAPEGSEGLFD